MTDLKKDSKTGFCFIVTAAVCWGFSSVVLLPQLYNLPTNFVVFMQNLIPLSIMSCFLPKEYATVLKLPGKDFFLLAVIAMFSGVIGILAIVKALFLVNFHQLSLVVLVQKVQPVFTIILASIFLKEKVSLKFGLWSAVVLIGIYLITFGLHLPVIGKNETFLIACFLSALSAISFSVNTIAGKYLTSNTTFTTIVFGRFLLATIFSALICLISGTFYSFHNITKNNWIILLVSFITLGPVSMYLYYYGLGKVKAIFSAIAELALPLSVLLLDYVINGTRLSIVQWIGTCMIIFGVIKISLGRLENKKQ